MTLDPSLHDSRPVEFEVLSKFYTTTAEAWEALAATELGLILGSPKRNRINMGIGTGL